MDVRPLKIAGACRVIPRKFPDRRGVFFESFRFDILSAAVGHPVPIRQVDFSVSRKNTLRGIHSTALPPGQAKFVTCVRGAVLDAVVDLRVGSPTFGEYEIMSMDAESGEAIYMPDGLGHAFLARTDDVCMAHFSSTEYVPGTMICVDALDSEIGLPWGLTQEPIRSDKDAAAPNLAHVAALGVLPAYDELHRPGVGQPVANRP